MAVPRLFEADERRRWLVVAVGVAILLCLGSIYSFSVLAYHIRILFEKVYNIEVTATELQLPYTVALLTYALTMPIASSYIDRYGPRLVTSIGAVFVSLGWSLSAFARSIYQLTLTYGVLVGLGLGIAYNCPIVAARAWFPDRTGLAVGLVVLGFGLAPAVAGPATDALVANQYPEGVYRAFVVLGIVYGVIIALLASMLRTPPPDFNPGRQRNSGGQVDTVVWDLSREEVVRTKAFYALWICFAIGTLVGLMVIGVTKLVGIEVAESAGGGEIGESVSDLLTRLLVLYSICNSIGRPIFGWLNDRVGTDRAAVINYTLTILASITLLLNPASLAAYTICFAILWLNLGGWLALAPSATAKLFGRRDFARNYGLLFTAYGAGALAGNTMVGLVKDVYGRYTMVFPYVILLSIVGATIAAVALRPQAAGHNAHISTSIHAHNALEHSTALALPYPASVLAPRPLPSALLTSQVSFSTNSWGRTTFDATTIRMIVPRCNDR
ncbi:MAG: OFA family MFS transporter [Ignisphaera sp.]|nr:OFA family MFS transporter [Ignisphaera sp.]